MSNRDPAVYSALTNVVAEIENAFEQGDAAAALEGDRLFHANLLAATRNSRLQRFHAQLQQEQRLALSLAERSRLRLGRTTDDHRELLDALRGNSTRAKAQLKAHLQAGETELLRVRQLFDQSRGS